MSSNWFIALRVPAETWFERVEDAPVGVRVFHPDDLHITVAFLGPVERQAADAAFAVAPKWPTPPLDVTLSGIGPMGNPRHASALAAEVDSPELNAAIATVRNEMCRCADARTDDRPPRAHVTIARLSRRSARAERARAIAWAQSIDLGQPRVHLTELILYRGTQGQSDRLFAEYDAYRLGGTGNP